MNASKRKRESNADDDFPNTTVKNNVKTASSVKSSNQDSQPAKKFKSNHNNQQESSNNQVKTSKKVSPQIEESSEDDSLSMRDEDHSSGKSEELRDQDMELKIKGFNPWIKDLGTEEPKPFPSTLHTSKAIKDLGFTLMTSVQRVSMTPMLEGKDVIIQAKTGSGKSLAFLVPIIERIIEHKKKNPTVPGPFALILVPIRELTTQLQVDVKALSKYHQITSATVTGGTNSKANTLYQSSPDIVLANPGRLADWLCKSRTLPHDFFSNLIVSVMDEADELHKPGFLQDVNPIIACLPQKRQRAYYSATYPAELSKVIPNYPSIIKITTINTEEADSMQVDTLENFTATASNDKFNDAVLSILRMHKGVKTMVFCATGKAVSFYEKFLTIAGIPCQPMSGKLSQVNRTKTFLDFRGSGEGVLISTDVSARGVDMKDVGLVFMIGQPSGTDVFVHRSGRTARAGKTGKCICLLQDWQTGFFSKAVKSGVKFQGEFEITYNTPGLKAKDVLLKVKEETRATAFRTTLFFMLGSGRPLNASGARIPMEDIIHFARSTAKPIYGLDSIYIQPSRNVPLTQNLWQLLNSPLQ